VLLLDKPYATAPIEGRGRVTKSTCDPVPAKRAFSTVLAAPPARRRSRRQKSQSVNHTYAVRTGQFNDNLSRRCSGAFLKN
jgi:hypothetical protein